MFRRSTTYTLASVFSAILVLFWAIPHLTPSDINTKQSKFGKPYHRPEPSSAVSELRLHFLIVATSSDLNLCRLLLSASILSYPPPILIDWEGEGEYDAKESHLAKVAGPLRYLESLSPDQASDIILLVDGFDVILQLAPDVLLKRYFEETADAHSRLEARFGADRVEEHGMYTSILFGPDKVCWPTDFRRAACWAVPTSPLSPDAFGPYTDMFLGDIVHARPRWLNSGTIMGPARDMLYMFQGTRDKINRTYDLEYDLRNSDQMYFADVWADQEYARALSLGRREEFDKPDNVEAGNIPSFQEDAMTEFHIGLDYRSGLFQPLAGYDNYIAWIIFNRTVLPTAHKTIEPYTIDLQKDILDSRNPFEFLHDDEHLQKASWRDVFLGVNTASGLAFSLLHFTGDKSFRDSWWPRMWYAGVAEQLQRAATTHYDAKIGTGPINGKMWLKHEPFTFDTQRQEEKLGAWSDRGKSLSWDKLCATHEESLYNTIS